MSEALEASVMPVVSLACLIHWLNSALVLGYVSGR